MISTRLYRERGRWIIMDSTMSYHKSIYLDIKKGIMVFVPRSGEHVFKIDRVVYCRFSHVYKLYFFNFEYLQMTYKIVNYSNQDDKDSIADQEELDNVNTRRIVVDLNKIRNFWRFIISKFRRDRLNFHSHRY